VAGGRNRPGGTTLNSGGKNGGRTQYLDKSVRHLPLEGEPCFRLWPASTGCRGERHGSGQAWEIEMMKRTPSKRPGNGIGCILSVAAALGSAWVVAGCRSTSPAQHGSAGPTDSGLAVEPGLTAIGAAVERASGATPLYSFQYYFGKRTLFVHLPAYDSAVTCASMEASMGRNYSDVWFLNLYIDWVTPRTEATIGMVSSPGDVVGNAAYLEVVHDRGKPLTKWVLSSTGGRITLASAPSDEADQIRGSQVRGRVEFSFPKEPRALTSCVMRSSWSRADGGGAEKERTCTCVDLAGTESSCTAGPDENCCTPLSSDVQEFSLDIAANPCGLFCATTPGDPNNCKELYGDF